MTTRTYHISGMHCGGCVNTVKKAFEKVPGLKGIQVQLTEPQAILSMEKDVSDTELQEALSAAGHYALSPVNTDTPVKKEGTSGLSRVLGLFHHKKSCCE